MNLSTSVVSALQLKRCDVPLELQSNFAALRHVPLFFAGCVKKLNHRMTVQDRVLIATLDHIYVCDPNGDILRCFPYSYIEMVLVDRDRHQMALIVPREHDVAFATQETYKLLHVIEVIRGLHHARTPMRVETINSTTAAGAEAADETADGGETISAAGRSKADAGESRSRWSRLVSWVRGRGRQPEWFSGPDASNCIGRGYYQLRLAKQPGFRLNLNNRND
jgi:hypothetical protein